MKKVLLYGDAVPDVIHNILAAADNKRTGKIIDKIEAIAEELPADNIIKGLLFAKHDTLYRFKHSDRDSYYGWNDKLLMYGKVDIVSIDETKRWIIEERDGEEYIREIPEYELIDPELGLYAEKRKDAVNA